MSGKYCQECGTALTEKYLENEGMIPFCPKCNQYRFPMYNVAVSMIVVNKSTDNGNAAYANDRVFNQVQQDQILRTFEYPYVQFHRIRGG